ncbi:DUF6932 family protein [Aeromonas salmonicida]|uniref:DUF6932 family protein n=1 Tax=Aeromonas salmonicida TaxID=645 RepID=UPI00283A9842|nr:hypothetical protein [Aeromonas salmonicida]
MPTVPIPDWNAVGLLPPIDQTNPISPERSPYSVAILDVVMRFATSPERCRVLEGFLNYRAALHNMGLVRGFQWLDGSFTEQVETLERRSPRDIDVVTFLHIPENFEPSADQLQVIQHDYAKANFLVDSYIVGLNELEPEDLVQQSAYWYSMWSHRRDSAWKGYLQIDLDPASDADARDRLNQLSTPEVQS